MKSSLIYHTWFLAILFMWMNVGPCHAQSKPIRRGQRLAFTDSIARQCRKAGDYAQAEATYKEALEDSIFKTPDRIKLAIDLAEIYLLRGMYTEAQMVLDQHQPIKEQTTQWQHWLMRKAQACSYQRKYDEATLYLDELEATGYTPINEVYDCRAFMLMQQGMENHNQHILQTAKNYFSKILKGLEGKDRYIVLSNMALTEAMTGKSTEALAHINECLNWQKSHLGENHPDYIVTLRKKAEILMLTGDKHQAKAVFHDYVEKERYAAITQFPAFTEQQRLNYWANKKTLISEAFTLEGLAPDFLYDVALLRHQVALLGEADREHMKERLQTTAAMVQKELRQNEVAVEFVKYERDDTLRYAALVMPKRGNVSFISLWSEPAINNLPVGGKQLIDALCSKSVDDKNAVYNSQLLSQMVWQPLATHIPKGSKVYFSPDGLLHLLAIEYLPDVEQLGYELHRVSSTGRLTERKTSKKSNGRFLLVGGLDYDDMPTADPTAMKDSAHKQEALHYYTNTRNHYAYFRYLQGSRQEVDTIRHFVSPVDVHYEQTEEDLKYSLSHYSTLHLSTHGYSLYVDVEPIPLALRDSITEDRSLLASGLALSGANIAYMHPDRDDALLSAREICDLDLRGLDLVVASCCQSAQGHVSDEGPAGIVRGLKKAGTKSVIATLWPVDDAATTLFMTWFYEAWRGGKGSSKWEAMRQARQRLRAVSVTSHKTRHFNPAKLRSERKAKETTTHPYDAPYFWAPFILIDDI